MVKKKKPEERKSPLIAAQDKAKALTDKTNKITKSMRHDDDEAVYNLINECRKLAEK